MIAALAAGWTGRSDPEVLAGLDALAPLPDEDDPRWDDERTWQDAYAFVALADVAAARRLRAAIRPLLDRAAFGDPGETMRGLCHPLEHVVEPDYAALADVLLEAARSDRPGTRLWAVEFLARHDDPRARAVFEEIVAAGVEPRVVEAAEVGLERLGGR